MSGLEIDLLVCTICKASLREASGYLVCENDDNHRFRYEANIVSFTGNHDFDKHWEPYTDLPIPDAKMESAERFLAPLVEALDEGSVVLDVGCGDGVHAAFLLNQCGRPSDIHFFGLDASHQALLGAISRNNRGIFIHADAADIPLESESVDAVFSYGVIAYTDDPAATVREMTRVLKPGGIVGIWVYLEPTGSSGRLLKVVRWITKNGGPLVTRLIADTIVPLMGILPIASGLNLRNASWSQCREVVLVNIAPEQLIFPDRDRFKKWISDAGLSVEREISDPPLAIWAKK